jgi:phenylpropionate dioxygenase-like ring-hydroxylating dioxygenase large terminal subunit
MLDSVDFAGSSAATDLRRVGIHPDHWFPMAWSRELKTGKPLAVRFAGDPIVLVRPKAGDIFALEDRCAHRQVPLHSGVVDQAGLRCGYHGWTYDKTGACTDVPYIGKGKLPNGVRAYPVAEVAGVVFVYTGRDTRAAPALPDLRYVTDPAYKTRYFGREIACHYSFMHENLIDMNHQFLHRRLMGSIQPRYLGRRNGPDWFEIDYTFKRTAGNQPMGEALVFGSKKGGSQNNRDVMTIRTEYPNQTLQILAGDDEPVMKLWINYVPLDREQRTNRTFGMISIRKPKIPGLLTAAWPALIWFTEGIFREDRGIVESEQRAHDEQGTDWNQEVFPAMHDLRALLARSGVPITDAPPERYVAPCRIAMGGAEAEGR